MIRILFLYKDHHHPDGLDVESMRRNIVLEEGRNTQEKLDSVGGARKLELVDPAEEISWFNEMEHCKEPDATDEVSIEFGSDEETTIVSSQLMELSLVMAEYLGRPLNYVITNE